MDRAPRTINILAAMARRIPLRLLEQACADQKSISTARLSQYVERAGDELAEYAHNLRVDYDALKVERDQLWSEVEALRTDAARYRWLCAAGYDCDPEPFRRMNDFDSDKQSIDAAIDAAMGHEVNP